MITYGREGVLVLDPDFFMYQEYAGQLNCPISFVKAEEDFSFAVEKILQAIEDIKPKLFILSNPQNPTGVQFSEEDLQKIADAMETIEGYFTIEVVSTCGEFSVLIWISDETAARYRFIACRIPPCSAHIGF